MLVSGFTYFWYTNSVLRAIKGILMMCILFVFPSMLATQYDDELSNVLSPAMGVMSYVLFLCIGIFLIFWLRNRYKITNCFIGTFSYKDQAIVVVDNKNKKEFVFRFEDIQHMIGKAGAESENDFPHFFKLKITHISGVSTHYIYVYPFDSLWEKNPKNIPSLELNKLSDDWGIYQCEEREKMRVTTQSL